MRVFLTGATGYIGSAIAEGLTAAGHQVTGMARSEQAARRLEACGIPAEHGDVRQPETVAAGARKCDAVIHTAMPAVREAGRLDRAVVEALVAAGRPLVYTSGVWVLGNTGERVADETWPVNPTRLVAWRAEVEPIALRAGAVIRPAMVYGRQGGVVMSFVNSARERGAARYVGTGENRWTWVHADDLADLYVRLLDAGAGVLVHAAAGPAIRVKEVAEAASRFAGAGGKTEAWPLEQARRELGAYADALALDQQVSGAKAERECGWRPRATTVLDEFAVLNPN